MSKKRRLCKRGFVFTPSFKPSAANEPNHQITSFTCNKSLIQTYGHSMTSYSFQIFDSSCLFHLLVGKADKSPLNAAGGVGKDVQKNYGEK